MFIHLALLGATIFGNVSSIMLRLYQGTEEFQERQTAVKEFIRFHKIPKSLGSSQYQIKLLDPFGHMYVLLRVSHRQGQEFYYLDFGRLNANVFLRLQIYVYVEICSHSCVFRKNFQIYGGKMNRRY